MNKIYAKIDNKVYEVKYVDKNYNSHASEVIVIEDGNKKGIPFIVEKEDFIKASDCRYIVQVSKFNDTTMTYQYKAWKTVYSLEEARSIKRENSYRKARIYDKLTKTYIK